MKKRLALLALFLATAAHAQAPSPAQIGVSPTTPQSLFWLDSTKTWQPLYRVLVGGNGVISGDGQNFLMQATAKTAQSIYYPFSSAFSGLIWDNVRSVMDVEPGSSISQVNALSGYLFNNVSNGTIPSAGQNNAVAVFGFAVANKDNSSTWGADFTVSDSPGTTGFAGANRNIYALEADATVFSNTGTKVNGVLVSLQGNGAPASANAFQAHSASPSVNHWTNGLICDDGACTVALQTGLVSPPASVALNSQGIAFNYLNSGLVRGAITLQALSTANLAVASTLLNDQIWLQPESGGNVEIAAFSAVDANVNMNLAGQGAASAVNLYSGTTLTMAVKTSGITNVNLPTTPPSGSSVGALTICIDSAGGFYKKATCP